MLQAWALKQGVDLKSQADIVFAAPPLLAEKLAQGELDAALEFLTFAARLQSKGFARAMDMADVERDLGAKGPVIVTGYVFTRRIRREARPGPGALFRHDGQGEKTASPTMTPPSPKSRRMTGVAGSGDPAAGDPAPILPRKALPTRPLAARSGRRRGDLQGSGRSRRPATGRRRDRTRPQGRVSPSRRPSHAMIRLVSLVLFLALWQVGAWFVGPHYLPDAAVGGEPSWRRRAAANARIQSRRHAGAGARRLYARHGRRVGDRAGAGPLGKSSTGWSIPGW